MPSIAAPIATSIRARSWTCGSEAALRITVGPRRQRRGHQRVLGRHHRRLVHQEVAGAQAKRRGLQLDVAPRARPWRRARGTRRGGDRAGGGRSHRRRAAASCARPKRASSGPASRNEARIRSASSESTLGSGRRSRRRSRPRRRRSTRPGRRAPRAAATIASTSLIRGTLRRITSSSVSRQAARIGSAPFLLPAGTIVPDSGTPPSITNFSISVAASRGAGQRSWCAAMLGRRWGPGGQLG